MRLPSPFAPSRSLRFVARRWLLMSVTAALLLGCGGGAGVDGGVGSGGTGSFAAGPVTGFGSVIVNAVRFDDSTARVEDADGNLKRRDDLRLGMSVEIDGAAIVPATATTLATSTATRIRYASELTGPIEGIDRAAGTLTVLGQLVSTSASTVFDDRLPGGLDALAVGRVIEVHGQFDATVPRYRATRVEPAATGAALRLRGVVSQIDVVAKTFRIGGATFAYGQASGTPADLTNGSFVRLALLPGTDSAGRRVVSSFRSAVSLLPDAAEAKVEGLITSFNSAASFSVNGQPVTTGNTTDFKDGSAGLAVGVRVEIEGSTSGGVLRAATVEIETEDEEEAREYEFEGQITSVDAAAGRFDMFAGTRSVTIDTTSPDLRFDDGSAADLKAGAKVEVKGILAAGGTVIEATRIKFDD